MVEKEGAEERGGRVPWGTVITVSMGSFITGASMMFIVLALPIMALEFEASILVIIWITLAYNLVVNALAVPMGKIGDLYGMKPVFILGFVIFAVASLLAYFAPTAESLIAYRILQGLGASMSAGLGQAIVVRHAPSAKRGRAIGVSTSAWAWGALAGPVIGGIALQFTDWRVLFLIMAIFGILIAILAVKTLPRISETDNERKYDLLGATLFTVALTTLLIGMTIGMGRTVGISLMIPMLVISALSFVLFVFTERRVANPMINSKLLRFKMYSPALALAFLDTLALHHLFLVMTFYLQSLRGFDPILTAMVLAVIPIIGILDPLGGLLADKIGPIIPISMGMLLKAFGFFMLLDGDISLIRLVLALATLGLSGFLTWTPITSMALGSLPKMNLGVGAGLLYSSRSIGGMISQAMSILIIALVAGQAIKVDEIFSRSADLVSGGQGVVLAGVLTVYEVSIAIAIISLLVALFFFPKARRMFVR